MRLYILLISLMIAATNVVSGQEKLTSSEELIRKGARLHDRGEYEEAIGSYQKALELNSGSMSAVYEMSLSYLRMEEHDKAIKYSSKVIEAGFRPLLVDAYAVKGTAMVEKGKVDDAVALFKDALVKCGEEYLLHFNLGLCYFKKDSNALAIEHLRKAIEIDATHSSSFLLYAYALNDTGHWLQSFYAFHFFLLLEPNTERSRDAFGEMYDMLMRDYEADAAELTVEDGVDRGALYESILEKRPQTDDAESKYNFFVDASRVIFFTLGQSDDSQSSLLWYFFVPTYQEVLNSGYFETYSRYVSVAYFDESLEWWTKNQEEVDSFIAWFEHGETETEMDSDADFYDADEVGESIVE